MTRRWSVPASVVLLMVLTIVANATTTNLYDGLGGVGYFGNIGDADGQITGQKFDATDVYLGGLVPATATIDRVGMQIAIDPNMPALGDPGMFHFRLSLWAWNTNFATTVAQTPLATSEQTWPGGFDGWVHLACSIPAGTGGVGNKYFIGVTCLGRALNGQWRVAKTNKSDFAVDSVCYKANTQDDTRELRLQLHWYASSCSSAAVASVTSVTNNVAQTETNPYTITLNGANLDTLTAANLVRRHVNGTSTTITGSLGSGTSTRQVSFNLTGAEAGSYDLALAQTCDRIANAFDAVLNDGTLIPLKNAVLVYLPALTNASFEDAWNNSGGGGYCVLPHAGNVNLPEAKHWCLGVDMSGEVGGAFRRDGDIYVPGCTGSNTVNGGDGVHYISFQYQAPGSPTWPVRNSMFQTVAAPNVLGQVAQKSADCTVAYVLSQGADLAFMKLRDGGPKGTVIKQQTLAYLGGGPLVTSATLSVDSGYTYTSNPPLLTIEIEYNSVAGTAQHAGHFDSVQLTAGCNLPWADADGDGDVDSTDFAAWQLCYSPVLAMPNTSECKCFERVSNGHIDEADFAEFVKCTTGPGIPWVACAP